KLKRIVAKRGVAVPPAAARDDTSVKHAPTTKRPLTIMRGTERRPSGYPINRILHGLFFAGRFLLRPVRSDFSSQATTSRVRPDASRPSTLSIGDGQRPISRHAPSRPVGRGFKLTFSL